MKRVSKVSHFICGSKIIKSTFNYISICPREIYIETKKRRKNTGLLLTLEDIKYFSQTLLCDQTCGPLFP